MKEIVGDLWDYYTKPDHICCITTNGFVKNNGCAVMGAGVAAQATRRFPNLPLLYGRRLKKHGNHVMLLELGQTDRLIMFPVKHKWWEDADLDLITTSANSLNWIATQSDYKEKTFVLPWPGCGNGKLTKDKVRPIIADILGDNVLVIDYE